MSPSWQSIWVLNFVQHFLHTMHSQVMIILQHFWRKGKIRPFSLMESSPQYMEAFGQLGEGELVPADCTADIGEYVCAMYGKPTIKNVNAAHLALFEQSYEPSKLGLFGLRVGSE